LLKRGDAASLLLQTGALDHLSNLLHTRRDRAERDEMAPARLRDEARERGFSGAGRAPEDHGRQLPTLDRAAQKASRPQEIRLPEEFLEIARPHALGEGGSLGAASSLFGKEIQRLGHEIGPRGGGALTLGGR